ncbi:hypothetical protein CF98_07085 [Halopseudomonas bauzanensis]|nr:hypothetical protein CF98_07085 [Halopseudomonas bauzanensis]
MLACYLGRKRVFPLTLGHIAAWLWPRWRDLGLGGSSTSSYQGWPAAMALPADSPIKRVLDVPRTRA